jgi:4-amino-4-deoxy-L-arabinose transferase-like glycosyltransferase
MRASPRRLTVLGALVVLGLAIRMVILWDVQRLPATIADEQQYVLLAHSLVAGDGFAWGPGRPTSLRPPLYPFLVAAVWRAMGHESLQAVRALQIALAALTSLAVFAIGRRVYDARAARWAAVFIWLYPSLIYANFTILTETLFTLLLVGFVLLAIVLLQTSSLAAALLCGIALGLATLTRSVVWPLPLVLCPLLVAILPGSLRARAARSALVLAGYLVCVTPWAVRNTRLQDTFTVVDTMGGLNLRMGNYEYTPEDRMWDAVSLTGEKSWVYGIGEAYPTSEPTEGQKDKWAQGKAIAYMRDHPGTTLRRSLIKFADLWGVDREFIAGVQRGMFAPPTWFAVAASLLMAVTFAAVALLGGAGLWLAAPAWRAHALLLLPLLAITAAHTIVFGHSRYHLPLIPILALYAGALVQRPPRVRSMLARPQGWGAVLTALVLLTIWARELIFVDLDRIRGAVSHILNF